MPRQPRLPRSRARLAGPAGVAVLLGSGPQDGARAPTRTADVTGGMTGDGAEFAPASPHPCILLAQRFWNSIACHLGEAPAVALTPLHSALDRGAAIGAINADRRRLQPPVRRAPGLGAR